MLSARSHLQDLVRVDSADIRGDFVRLDRNERVSALPPDVVREMFASMDPRVLSSYPDPQPLVHAFAAAESLPPDHVVAANGSDAAIRRVFHAFVAPGDTVVMATPTYAMYGVYARIAEAHPLELAYGADLRLAPECWHRALAASPRMLCLVNPDNPTGAVLPRHDIVDIIAACARRDVLCLVDEAYYPCHGETVIGLVRQYPNLVVTRSLSKAFGLAGLRLGFAAAQPPIIEALAKVRGLHEVNSIAVHVGSYMLARPALVARFVADLEAGRSVLIDFARRHTLGVPNCPTNFQLMALPPPLDPGDLVARLRSSGYLIKGGFRGPLSRCVRVTLDAPEMMERLVAALEEALAAPLIAR